MAKKSKSISSRRHIMRFDLGGPRPMVHPVKVARPKSKEVVKIELSADDVRIAMAQKGHGDAQRCAGAVCTQRHSHRFPHPVHYIDWTQSRAYVITKLDKLGMPAECISYVHHDNVAELFDKPSGYKQLLKVIQENGGALKISLRPDRVRPRASGGRNGVSGSKAPMTAAQRAKVSVPRGIHGRIFRTQGMVEAALARKAAARA